MYTSHTQQAHHTTHLTCIDYGQYNNKYCTVMGVCTSWTFNEHQRDKVTHFQMSDEHINTRSNTTLPSVLAAAFVTVPPLPAGGTLY